jgi:hypothetical protein
VKDARRTPETVFEKARGDQAVRDFEQAPEAIEP